MERGDFDRVILIEDQTEFEPCLSITALKKIQLAQHCSMLVIDPPESLVGPVAYAIFERNVRRNRASHIEIFRLGVQAGHQHRQYGLQLIQAVYGRLKLKGDRMTWRVRIDDGPRLNFLNRIGFGRATLIPSHCSLPDSLYFVHEFHGEISGPPPKKYCSDFGWE